jgi:hypothetical protein
MNFLLTDQTIPVIDTTLDGDSEIVTTLLNSAPAINTTLSSSFRHDLALVNGNLSFTAGLAQRIDCALRTVQGEWWLDPAIGMPYFTEVFKKYPDLTVLKQAFSTVIYGVQGVTKINDLQLTLNRATRVLTVTFHATGTAEIASGTTGITL